MDGFELTGSEKVEDIPAKITATAISLLETSLKSISSSDFSRLINILKKPKI